MFYIWMVVKGIFMGVANIIPGVSGGTMAVSLGIYDDLIYSITHITKDWKKSVQILLPIIGGLGIGVIGFSYLIELLLSNYTLPTALAFIGLILGGIPILMRSFLLSLKQMKQRLSYVHVLVFLTFFALVVAMAMIQGEESGVNGLTLSVGSVIALFFVGMVTSATMVVPGISGSLILMVLGYYYGILNSITQFFDALRAMDMDNILHYFGILFPFGVGVILGVFLISKVIEYLFKNKPSFTYSGILGLVVASPIAILINTQAFNDLAKPNAPLFLLVGVVLALISFAVTYYLGRKDPELEQE
ncbi:DUF368 domain-containing protein [Lacticigenium naphthae]|uniref:DUF368 domain-containing protein n=1 Tax=Lacticigenium naphthae TaxID=515351 RepID=UPI00040DF8A7|nr:DUF368 domain-containing protein [Lacticigenium naphthae]